MKTRQGIAPIVLVLMIALGLSGATTAGYTLREPIKKTLTGITTADEIKSKVQQEITRLEAGKSKFELQGVTTAVDVSENTVNVKIKNSTNSIKSLRLSDTPIVIPSSTIIILGSTEDLKIADIPINAQVHIAGTINDGVLTANKIIIQKEDVSESKVKATKFNVQGMVKSISTDSLTVDVKSSNKFASSKKGQELIVKIVPTTIIEKNEATILLTDISVNDNIIINGVIVDETYNASKIIVKVIEQAGEITDAIEVQFQTEQTQENSGNSSKNQKNKQ